MKLLIALETSDNDAAAIGPAGKLARECSAEVILLNMLNPLTDASGIVADTREEAVRQLLATRRAYLEEHARDFDPPAQTLVAELHHGEDTAEGIARVAREHGTDILVIATHHADSVREVILGSVAQGLIRLNPCPILVVPV